MAFDGGGLKGVLSAVILTRINEHFPDLIEKTELFAGTSTGSLISLALAYGLSPNEIVKLYIRYSEYIFTPSANGIFKPKFDNKNLKEVLNSVFPRDLKLMQLKKRVIVTAFRVIGSNYERWAPVFFNNYPNSPTRYEKVVDAALSSTAVPGYFPSHNKNIDGGVVATNPSTVAICMAKDRNRGNIDINNMYLLSIGTGFNDLKITADTSEWGALQWAQFPYPPLPLLSLILDGMVQTDEYYSSKLLEERYMRLNPELPCQIDMDDYEKIPVLIDIANKFDISPAIQWIEENWY
jgi:patatin-like phospholipase/acyl hydrolase